MNAAGPQQQFFDALDAGSLQIQRCEACTRHVFYPRMQCPHCGAVQLAWVDSPGKGAVYSTTVLRRKADAGGDVNVVLVDLDEGVRMMSRVEGMDPAAVRIGMRVKARIAHQDGASLVVFDPAEE